MDAELGDSGPLSISDPRNLAGPRFMSIVITDLATDLEGHSLLIADHAARGDVADADLAESKRSALDAAQEFGRKVRAEGLLRHLAPRLPDLPKITDGEGPFMNAMTSVRQRWKMAETLLAAPFPLTSGENFSGFAARIESLRGKFALAEDANVDAAVEARFAPEFLTAGATARFRIYVVHRQRARQRNRRRHPALIRSGPRRFPRSGFRRGMKW